ncbi:MAG: 50S ribosomal protein L25 [Planctomycetota bacterium]
MLKATKREALGTRASKKLRLQGKIPCSLQGEGKPNVDIAIDEREFLTLRRQHEHVFDFEIEGGDEDTALVRELQWDTIGERILHVEFRRVIRGQKTDAEVALHFVGHAKGGVVNHLINSVQILALPRDIPDGLEVNVDGLEPGQTMHASDIQLPEGVELAIDPTVVIANVTVPRGDEPAEAEGEESADGEAGAAPEPTEG